MRSLKLSVLDAFDDLRTGGFARPTAEKFGGAWLACFLVMARGNVLAAFSLEHVFRASVCGIVSAAVAVALLAQMDRTIDSAARQATISAIATFLGDVFAHPSHTSVGRTDGHGRCIWRHCHRPVVRQAVGEEFLREAGLTFRPLPRPRLTTAGSSIPASIDRCSKTLFSLVEPRPVAHHQPARS